MSSDIETTFKKTPEAVLDYKHDWSDWLDTGEGITSSTWQVESGLTKDSDTNDTDSATIWLSGGSIGRNYRVTNTIVTDAATPRTESRSFFVNVTIRGD